jgi:hypothetical protein
MPRLTLHEYGGILCNGGYVVVIRSDGNRVDTLRGDSKCAAWRCAYTEKYVVAEDALLRCAATRVLSVTCVRIIDAPPGVTFERRPA